MDLGRINVIGAGAWGTSLACVLAQRQERVMVWAHDPARAEQVNRTRFNSPYLPDIEIPSCITLTPDPQSVADADAVLLVVPSHHVRSVCALFAAHLPRGIPVVVCAKGIEAATGLLMTDIVAELWPACPVAALTGPSFAAEVARGLPTAVTLSSGHDRFPLAAMAAALHQPFFAVCPNTDPVGSQIGGAVKNVVAIACGVLDGAGAGHNARAAVMTAGFLEILHLAQAMGGRAETVVSLSGFGDLTLTCNSPASRNYRFGRAVGEGQSPAALLGATSSVIEGAENAPAVLQLAARHGLHLPVCASVNALVAGKMAVAAFVTEIAQMACQNEIIFA